MTPAYSFPAESSPENRLRPVGFRSGHCGSPWTGAFRPLEADRFSPAPSRIPLTQRNPMLLLALAGLLLLR